MATCDPTTLQASAKCLECLSDKQLLAIIAYQLAVKNGGSTDANVLNGLATAAKFGDPSEKELLGISSYLLCQLASGGGGSPGVLNFLASTLTDLQLPSDNGDVEFNFPNLVSVTGGSLNFTSGILDISGSPTLTKFSAPLLTTVSGNLIGSPNQITAFNCPALTTFFVPNLIFNPTVQVVDLFGCALDEATVNQILARGVASGCAGAGVMITLSGGTNHVPTGQGITDLNTLAAALCNVSTN